MENVRNYVDIKLIIKWDGQYGAEAMIAKPNFQPQCLCRKFDRRRNAQARGEIRQADLRGYVLNILKVCLYEFHHKYMSPIYRNKYKIMYTDSLIYHIECDDVYENMKRDIH